MYHSCTIVDRMARHIINLRAMTAIFLHTVLAGVKILLSFSLSLFLSRPSLHPSSSAGGKYTSII